MREAVGRVFHIAYVLRRLCEQCLLLQQMIQLLKEMKRLCGISVSCKNRRLRGIYLRDARSLYISYTFMPIFIRTDGNAGQS